MPANSDMSKSYIVSLYHSGSCIHIFDSLHSNVIYIYSSSVLLKKIEC